MYGNPMIPLFEGKKITASGIVKGEGNYTAEMFADDFPQFTDGEGTSHLPTTVLDMFIEDANSTILPDVWGKRWRYASGLFVAHRCALYLKTFKESSATPQEAAADMVGVVKSATMGDTSVSYDNSAITEGTKKWGTWNATEYGAQLVTEARAIGISGSYVV